MPKFSIDLEARIAKFQDSLDQVGKSTERLTGRIERSFKKIGRGFSLLGVGFGATALVSQIRQTADELDLLGKRAEKTGATVEGLSRIQFGLNLNAGFNDEQVDRILTNIARKFKEAESASSGAAKAFARLGIDPRKYTDTTVALLDITEALAKIPPGADRVGLAMQALGEELGPKALPAVGTMRQASDEAERLGLVLSKDATRAATEFNDALTILGGTATAIKVSVFGPVISELADLATAFRVAGVEGIGFFDALELLNTVPDTSKLEREILRVQKLLEDPKLDERTRKVQEGRLSGLQSRLGQRRKDLEENNELLKKYNRDADAAARQAAEASKRFQDALKGGKGSGAGGSSEEKVSAGERYIDSLKRQQEALQDLTEVEQLRADIAAGRVEFSAGEERRAQAIAAQIDAERERTRALEEQQSEFENFLSQQVREREQLEQAAQAYKQLADPVQQYLDKLDQIAKLQGIGLLTDDEAAKSSERIYEQIAALSNLNDKTEEVSSAYEQLGENAQDALADAVFEADNFGDALRRLLIEFAKLEFKKSVLGPLFDGVTSFFGGGAAADLAGSSGEAGLIGLDSLPAVKLSAPSTFGAQAQTVINEYRTYNIPADVSISSVEAAVARGSQATENKLVNSRQRGGVFA